MGNFSWYDMSKFTNHNALSSSSVNGPIRIDTEVGIGVEPQENISLDVLAGSGAGYLLRVPETGTVPNGTLWRVITGLDQTGATQPLICDLRFTAIVEDPRESRFTLFLNNGNSFGERLRMDGNGETKLQIGSFTSPVREAALMVQTSSTYAKPVLALHQDDVDDSFINFDGTAGADTTSSVSTLTTSGAVQGHIQIEINGVKRWIPFVADPS